MRRFWIYLSVATLVGGVFLWLAARELPWADVGLWAQQVDPGHMAVWSVMFTALYAICHAARVFRWYEVVRPIDDEIAPGTVHRVCAVGFTAILLLPLRLGELVRPYLLAKRSRLGVSPLLGTAVVERVVDGLVVTGMLFATLATYSGTQNTVFAHTTGAISAAIFIPALFVCLFALWRKEQTVSIVRRLVGIVSKGLADTLAGMLEAFIDGLRGLAGGPALLRFLAFTVIYWTMNVVSLWVLATYGFGFDLGLWQAAAILAILVIGIMIPAGPAMAGNFEFFILRGMGLYVALEGVWGVRAAAFGALLHILQFIVIVIPGFIVMWSDPDARHLVRLSEEAEAAT